MEEFESTLLAVACKKASTAVGLSGGKESNMTCEEAEKLGDAKQLVTDLNVIPGTDTVFIDGHYTSEELRQLADAFDLIRSLR